MPAAAVAIPASAPRKSSRSSGRRTRVEATQLPLETQKKEVDVVRYYYQQDGQDVELHFFDNKLIEKVPLLGSAARHETSPLEP